MLGISPEMLAGSASISVSPGTGLPPRAAAATSTPLSILLPQPDRATASKASSRRARTISRAPGAEQDDADDPEAGDDVQDDERDVHQVPRTATPARAVFLTRLTNP